MRALVTSESGLQIEDVPEFDAGPGPVLVGNHHLAINFGDLNGSRNRPAGSIPGWDGSSTNVATREIARTSDDHRQEVTAVMNERQPGLEGQ